MKNLVSVFITLPVKQNVNTLRNNGVLIKLRRFIAIAFFTFTLG